MSKKDFCLPFTEFKKKLNEEISEEYLLHRYTLAELLIQEIKKPKLTKKKGYKKFLGQIAPKKTKNIDVIQLIILLYRGYVYYLKN